MSSVQLSPRSIGVLVVAIVFAGCNADKEDVPVGQTATGLKTNSHSKSPVQAGSINTFQIETATDGAISEVTLAHETLCKSLREQRWDSVAELMTQEGKKHFTLEQASLLVMANEDLPSGAFLPPGMDEAIEKATSLAKEYQVDFDVIKKTKPADGNDSQLVEVLKKTGRSWELACKLWDLQAGTSFHIAPALGEITEVAIEHDTAFLQVQIELPQEFDEGGMMMQMVIPPMVVRWKKAEGAWKYDGIDDQRTEKLVSGFMGGMMDMQKGATIDSMPGGAMMEPHPTVEAPSFSATNYDGQSISLKDYSGKVVLIDCWGTWCPPCVEEFPALKRVREEFAEHGFEILGVAVNSKKEIKRFVEENGINWPNVVDLDSEICQKFQVNSFPTTMLIDKSGKHVASNLSKTELVDELVERLGLDEANYKGLKHELMQKEQEAMAQAFERMQAKQKK